MDDDRSPKAVLEALGNHPKGDDLARLVHAACFAAAEEHRENLADGLEELCERAALSRDDGETPYGNVFRALERGSSEALGSAARLLLSVLLARGVALSPPSGAE